MTTIFEMNKTYTMKKIILILLLLTFNFSNAQAITDFFKKTDTFLKKHVQNNKINYKEIKSKTTALDSLIHQIGFADVSKENDDVQKAFYINAYNLILINEIVENYPVKSPMDISGVFDKKTNLIAGAKLTLNDIENKMIRAKYNDARIHFVLVCGANSCPPITNFAYFPEKLDAQLNEQTLKTINNQTFIKIDIKSKKVAISQIFEWYKDDFVTKKTSLIDFLNKYLETPIDDKYKVSYYHYDWSLNTTK